MTRDLDPDDLDDLDDAPESEVEEIEAQVLDEATAARSIAELRIEIETLKELERLALDVRRSGRDRSFREERNPFAVRPYSRAARSMLAAFAPSRDTPQPTRSSSSDTQRP